MKLLIAVFIVALLCLPVFAILPETSYKTDLDFPRRYGVERVTNYDPRVNYNRIETIVYLSPVEPTQYKGVGRGGYAPMYPRATARIKSTDWYGYPTSQIHVLTKDLPPSYEIDGHFEVWLVDQETNYRLSIGTFTTGFGGVGSVWYRFNNYMAAYDFIEITAEPLDDWDVNPGPVALLGAIVDKIPPPEYYNPEPKETRMVTSYLKNY